MGNDGSGRNPIFHKRPGGKRNSFCPNYSDCLDDAIWKVKDGILGFSCEECSLFKFLKQRDISNNPISHFSEPVGFRARFHKGHGHF